MAIIDLRSDTVTRPTDAMRQAMAGAEVGDDVFGDDPTVKRLERLAAEKLGKEDALFVGSGTQSNLVALLTHCGRGDEYIVGQKAHTYIYEGGGGAALGGIQPQPMLNENDGTLDLAKVGALVKPDDFHFAQTRLLCLENTFYGKVLPLDYLEQARALADEHGLRLHLDGARLFNAAVALECEADEIAAPFDTISICLSKGLGAPVGSVLVGDVDFIEEARRWRKVVGGGMRQSGVLAAAGIYVLENHIERLADDHANAAKLAKGLEGIEGVEMEDVATNMVFVRFPKERLEALSEHLEENGILALADYNPVRLVTHLDVDAAGVERVVEVIGEFLASS
ncbi:MAG: low-specificity L-threonine aldolase [Verrucomicrobiota bacterium]